jgi:hypothetical protein
MMPPGRNFNAEHFFTHIAEPLLAKIFSEGRKSHALRLNVHLHNSLVHFSNALKQFFDEISLVTFPHPLYSPDLALSDFWLFGHIKSLHAGRVFSDADGLLEALIEFLNEVQPSELQPLFYDWIKRVK